MAENSFRIGEGGVRTSLLFMFDICMIQVWSFTYEFFFIFLPGASRAPAHQSPATLAATRGIGQSVSARRTGSRRKQGRNGRQTAPDDNKRISNQITEDATAHCRKRSDKNRLGMDPEWQTGLSVKLGAAPRLPGFEADGSRIEADPESRGSGPDSLLRGRLLFGGGLHAGSSAPGGGFRVRSDRIP